MSLFLVTEFAAYVFVRTFRFYKANVHYNPVLPNLKLLIHMFERFLFRQRNDEQPAGAKWAGASGSTLDCGFFSLKNNGLPAGAEKKSQEHSPTLDRFERLKTEIQRNRTRRQPRYDEICVANRWPRDYYTRKQNFVPFFLFSTWHDDTSWYVEQLKFNVIHGQTVQKEYKIYMDPFHLSMSHDTRGATWIVC
jgi:hypothetical protein